ncbi:MAG: hypothetical protein WD066_02805 [Planctomycetaceae bacterium]
MTRIADRLPVLVAERLEHIKIIEAKQRDPEEDKAGWYSAALSEDMRFFGIAAYVLDGDVDAFRSKLTESARLYLTLFERFERGELSGDSWISMLSHKHLFDSLAAGAKNLATSFASHMGGRDKIEKKTDHPFDRAMGYTLRAFVLNDRAQIEVWTPQFIERCERTRASAFLGYGKVFQAILEENTAAANEGLQAIVKGHRKQSKGRGIFAGIVDEVLCVWGIGMANLARWRGLAVDPIPPLIPGDLLVN